MYSLVFTTIFIFYCVYKYYKSIHIPHIYSKNETIKTLKTFYVFPCLFFTGLLQSIIPLFSIISIKQPHEMEERNLEVDKNVFIKLHIYTPSSPSVGGCTRVVKEMSLLRIFNRIKLLLLQVRSNDNNTDDDKRGVSDNNEDDDIMGGNNADDNNNTDDNNNEEDGIIMGVGNAKSTQILDDKNFIKGRKRRKNNILLVHGINGSSKSSSIKFLTEIFLSMNYRVICYNSRGVLNKIKYKDFAHVGQICDIIKTVDFIAANYSGRISVLGLSMGANRITKYMASSPHPKVISACAICNPFDYFFLLKHFSHNSIYRKIMKKFGTFLYQTYIKNVSGSGVNGNSIEEIDGATAIKYNYNSLEEFYYDCSSTNFISKIKKPILFISSEDDPLVPIEVVPHKKILANKNCGLVVMKGGHLGFKSLFFKSTIEKILIQYFELINRKQ